MQIQEMKYDVYVLVDRNHKDNNEAVEEWIDYLTRFLFGLKLSENYSLIEEVISEALTRIIEKIDTFDQEKSKSNDGGRAWASQIARNKMIDTLDNQNKIKENEDALKDLKQSNHVRKDYTLQDKITDLISFTGECVNRLIGHHLKVFLLAFNTGMTNLEIARLTSESEDVIKEQRTYARRSVIDCIDEKSRVKWVIQNREEKTFRMFISESSRDDINDCLKYLTKETQSLD